MYRTLLTILTFIISGNSEANINTQNRISSYKNIELSTIADLGKLPKFTFKATSTTYGEFYDTRDAAFEKYGVMTPQLLRDKEFKDVIAHLEKLSSEVAKDISQEKKLDNEIFSMYILDEEYQSSLNELVAAYPNSHFSYLLRSAYAAGRAYAIRGGNFASEIDDATFDKMKPLISAANKDIERSLKINNQYVHTYLVKYFFDKFFTTEQDAAGMDLKKALDLKPYSYSTWFYILEASAPRWSGSSTAMKIKINEMKTYYKQNPLLSNLETFIFKEEGDQARFAGNKQEALKIYLESLNTGTHHYISMETGRILNEQGDWRDGCVFIVDALELAPYFKQVIYDKIECDRFFSQQKKAKTEGLYIFKKPDKQ